MKFGISSGDESFAEQVMKNLDPATSIIALYQLVEYLGHLL